MDAELIAKIISEVAHDLVIMATTAYVAVRMARRIAEDGDKAVLKMVQEALRRRFGR